MLIRPEQAMYGEVPMPAIHRDCVPVPLTDNTMKERRKRVLDAIIKAGYDALAIYADREHGGSFAYLTGFSPRFEEAVLILHRDGTAFLLLGNEMLHMVNYSRIPADAILVPYFSLPNQPMNNEKNFCELLEEAGIHQNMKVGLAGWKLFRSGFRGEEHFLEVPSFIVDTLRSVAGAENVENASGLLIDPGVGVRTIMNANEIAFYEYGSCLASMGMADLLDNIEPGMTELQAAGYLENNGEPNCVQTICASGQRFTGAVVSPRNKKIERGEPFSATVGYRGGLTNRVAFLVSEEAELPEQEKDYMERIAKPYFAAAASWYASVGTGVKAADIYNIVDQVIPKEQYGWTLNPGHYVADEEWLSSPFFADSEVILKSGMMLQMDIIIKVAGYHGCNAEDGVVIMDEKLQQEMRLQYPDTWKRFIMRKWYMEKILNIPMRKDVFPMSEIGGYVRPYLLNRKCAFKLG